MQKDCLAGLHHSVGNKSASAMHKFCPDRWCKYQQDKKYGTTTYDHNKAVKKALPSSYLKHMLPLYTRLTNEDLLMGCIPGLTQNQNESFNATVWKRCPKEKRFGGNSVKRAMGLAVMTWNSGKQYSTLLENMHLSSNWHTHQSMKSKDVSRVHKSAKRVKKSEDEAKRRREKIRAELRKRQKSGLDYQPGAY